VGWPRCPRPTHTRTHSRARAHKQTNTHSERGCGRAGGLAERKGYSLARLHPHLRTPAGPLAAPVSRTPLRLQRPRPAALRCAALLGLDRALAIRRLEWRLQCRPRAALQRRASSSARRGTSSSGSRVRWRRANPPSPCRLHPAACAPMVPDPGHPEQPRPSPTHTRTSTRRHMSSARQMARAVVHAG
jgi:hypothetical protein